MGGSLDRDSAALTALAARVPGRFWTVALWAGPIAFLTVLYAYPMASVLVYSFARAGDLLAEIYRASQSASLRHVFAFTWAQAMASTVLTLAVGLPGAYLLARVDIRGRGALRALSLVPFVLPTLVVAAAFNALLGPSGALNRLLIAVGGSTAPQVHLERTLAIILLAHVFYNTALVMRIVGDAWSQMDPDLANAARVLGASRRQAVTRVTAPLLAPALIASTLLVFLFTFTSFGVILVLGGPRFATLEVEIYYRTVALFDLPLAAILAVIQLACTLAVTVGYTYVARRMARPRRLRSAAGTGSRPHGAARVLWAGYAAFLFAFLLGPLVALALRSVTPLPPGQSGFTTAYYDALLENPRRSAFYAAPASAIETSLAYATATAVLAIGLGMPAAWALVHRPRSRGGSILEPLLLLPLGTSAVTLGLGFIIALDKPPLDLRASPLLVPLAHTLVAFPFVVRVLVPSLATIQPRMREAAAVLGASPAEVARRIDLPLAGRAVAVAAVFAFVISMGEFGATAMVARPEHPTMPIVIERFLTRPGVLNQGQGLAMATLLMLVTAGGIAAVERLRVAAVGEF